ncbi:D-glycero-alpha-D-manno-heptose-1,7-bisphosphate 7-phosphatase [Pseudopelagicola sp. nBUS_20]|uniref:D-glycero-alpha-D-manno-heptose-1,7-bisphosphate 7-phosphatase n=1 Tax=Pseudopelagicola sp. nBUS_20 TaxID=3395317 RepID=UPI003EB6B1EA
MSPALFLDRDGVINKDNGYTHIWTDHILITGIVELIRRYRKINYKIIVITNQSGIGRGYYSDAAFHLFMENMETELERCGAKIDHYYYCGCDPSKTKCLNRKPMPGLFLKATVENNIKLEDSIMVGDKITDLVAAHRAGVPSLYLFDELNNFQVEYETGFRYNIVEKLREI